MINEYQFKFKALLKDKSPRVFLTHGTMGDMSITTFLNKDGPRYIRKSDMVNEEVIEKNKFYYGKCCNDGNEILKNENGAVMLSCVTVSLVDVKGYGREYIKDSLMVRLKRSPYIIDIIE